MSFDSFRRSTLLEIGDAVEHASTEALELLADTLLARSDPNVHLDGSDQLVMAHFVCLLRAELASREAKRRCPPGGS